MSFPTAVLGRFSTSVPDAVLRPLCSRMREDSLMSARKNPIMGVSDKT